MAHYIPLTDRTVIEISGEDRIAFLQGLVSQDVEKVTAEAAKFSAFLTPQGKFLHDFFMAAVGDTLWLDVNAGRAADLARRLKLYKLRSKVTLKVRTDLFIAAVLPEGLRELPVTSEAGAAVGWHGGVVFTDPRDAAMGARIIIPEEGADAALAGAGLTLAEESAYNRHRLALGIPDGVADLELEKSTLLESNYDQLGAIDWKKGCYMGQELTARTKYRGLVKRQLAKITWPGDTVPEAGRDLVNEAGKPVGSLRSGVVMEGQVTALASVRLDALEAPILIDGVSVYVTPAKQAAE